jgi:hypothetical protein
MARGRDSSSWGRPEIWSAVAVPVLVIGLLLLGRPPSVAAETVVPVRSPLAQVTDSTFRHDRHTGFACLDCHAMQPSHGVRLIQNVSDCRGCHHVRERVDRECAACHAAAELRNVVYPVARALTFSVRDDTFDRELRFSHAAHEERECVECHTGGTSLAVPDLDCQSCHEEHHVTTNPGCMSCHRQPPEDAHTLEVHRTCAGSGCHTDAPIEPPRTRVGCLWCHEDRVDHEPQGECVECHFVPRPPLPSEQSIRRPGEAPHAYER